MAQNADMSEGRTTPRWAMIAGALLAAWVAFTFSFTPLRTSTDEWWHLKSGRYIVEHGLPQNDIFTYTAQDRPWYNHEWLAQVIMWEVFVAGRDSGLGGVRAVILFKTLFIIMAFAGFGWLLARRMREPMWAWLVAAIALSLARRHFYPRPPFISYLLIALVFWMLIEWRSGRLRERWLWLLAPVFALWANLHGGWAAGILFIGAFWADAAWELGVDYSLGAWTRPQLRRVGLLTGLGIACTAATLANPYGVHLYHMFTNVMSDPYLKYIIAELLPPDWPVMQILEAVVLLIMAVAIRPVRWWSWLVMALWLAAIHYGLMHILAREGYMGGVQPNAWLATAVAVIGWTVLIVRVRPAGWVAHLLLGAFFLQQGIHHVRHLALTALAIMPGLAWGLEAWSGELAAHYQWHAMRHRHVVPAAILAGLAFWWTFCPLYSLTVPRSYEEPYWMRNARLMPESVRAGISRLVPESVQRGIMWLTPEYSRVGPTVEYEPGYYPREEMDLLIQAGLPGPLFTDGNTSGYYMWRLAPDLLTDKGYPIPGRPGYKIFTDNRYDIYGGQFVPDEHSVLNGLSEAEAANYNKHLNWNGHKYAPWKTVIKKWGIQTIIVPNAAKVINRELAKGGWVRVANGVVAIWVQDTPENRPAIERAKKLMVNGES
ncbi:hypothetical protein LLG95_17900 [bacterium]|nr:hypothetical protein [bacterium]